MHEPNRRTHSLNGPKVRRTFSSDSTDITKSSNNSKSADIGLLPLITTTTTTTTSSDSSENMSSSNVLIARFLSYFQCLYSMRFLVLVVLALQNSLFTVLRRYSQGVLKENYSTYEVLLAGEAIKILFSAWMIRKGLEEHHVENRSERPINDENDETVPMVSTQAKQSKDLETKFKDRIRYLIINSKKMVGLALIYGAMNILSFVSLRNIGAGMFTIFAQCKILTTASFSTILLGRKYTWTQWRSLAGLIAGVLLFSEPIWGNSENLLSKNEGASVVIGTGAVITEVVLSGFASIYFEKVIKHDPLKLSIWERNFQLALGSFPVYLAFITAEGGGKSGLFGGWSFMALVVASLGAAGGILVALSIKYGDAIMKTLATTTAIVLSSFLDWMFLGGDITPVMCIAAFQVIISICNYSFDTTPQEKPNNESGSSTPSKPAGIQSILSNPKQLGKDFERNEVDDEESTRAEMTESKRLEMKDMKRQINGGK